MREVLKRRALICCNVWRSDQLTLSVRLSLVVTIGATILASKGSWHCVCDQHAMSPNVLEEVRMSVESCGLSSRSLAELALVISRVSPDLLVQSDLPGTETLSQFWQSCRSLERRWMKELDEWTVLGTMDVAKLEQLASRVFSCEMLVRTFSTVLAELDRRSGDDTYVRLARNAVNGLLCVRHGIMSRLLTIPHQNENRVLEIDRSRRRFDRWTDLLIGTMYYHCHSLEFAYDPERASDFGSSCTDGEVANAPRVAEHFVAAGIRLKFVQHLTDELVNEPELVCLCQAILGSIPGLSFHRDGTLRSGLERRIAASRLRVEQRAVIAQTPYMIQKQNKNRIEPGSGWFGE